MFDTGGKARRIAVLGGSFDPIHLGHLHIAEQILKFGQADEVWFIPAGMHRFKTQSIVLDFDNRKALIEKAIASEPHYKCLDLDKAGMGDGSTYEIMQKLKSTYPQHQFSFLIGMDNLPQLPSWVNFAWLKENIRFIIAVRPGYSPDSMVTSQLKDFSYLNCPPKDISSTAIRYRLKSGLSIQGMVPHFLLIEITRLYRALLK